MPSDLHTEGAMSPNPNAAIKVCVGLSGGVDSSVAALLLKQQGYDVFAMFMQNWHDADATLHGDCEWEEDRFVAELVARKIGIPFYFVDLSGPYRQRVVDYMFDEYARGRTPNPDVLCNREIKFDAFLAAAKRLGADYVATGHYVRKVAIPADSAAEDSGCKTVACGDPSRSLRDHPYPLTWPSVATGFAPTASSAPSASGDAYFPKGVAGAPGSVAGVKNGQGPATVDCADGRFASQVIGEKSHLRRDSEDLQQNGGDLQREEAGTAPESYYCLLEGVDPNKDQSYFLCQLSQEQLRQAMFPIGELTKPEVRQIAKEADLPSAEKKDSQGICFVGKVDLPTFLKQKLAPAPGDVVEVFPAWYEASEHYQAQKSLLASLLRPGIPLEMTTYYAPEVKVLTTDGEPLGECPFDLKKLAALTEEDLRLLATPEDYSGIQFETETYRSGKKHIKKTRWKPNPYGVIAGQHDGAQFYTVGQRKGLNIGGHTEPIFVIATDPAARRVYVGEGHAHPGLSRRALRIAPDEIHWLSPELMEEGVGEKSVATLGHVRGRRGGVASVRGRSEAEAILNQQPSEINGGERLFRCRVRIRYRQPLQGATLLFRPGGLYILFDKPQRGITPGQFAACYDGEALFLSGVISE